MFKIEKSGDVHSRFRECFLSKLSKTFTFYPPFPQSESSHGNFFLFGRRNEKKFIWGF